MKNYIIHGFIASGTYGKVFKASKGGRFYAVKTFFKPAPSSAEAQKGVSISAIREISICKEMKNDYVVQLLDIFLNIEEKTISLVFEYAEHDLLQILHYHAYNLKHTPIPEYSIKCFLLQLIKGVKYLHSNYIMHRDLKPANILVTASGVVKIADLGLARVYRDPIQPLFSADKVVVTIWYRAPELLLGTRHYTPSIDIWAIGCIFAELFLLRPIFKGEEVKVDPKKRFPFQRDQLKKIISILGCPTSKL
jgi:cyclin-dependent kinase 8/11